MAERGLAALHPQVEEYEALSHQVGETPADLALAWLLHQRLDEIWPSP